VNSNYSHTRTWFNSLKHLNSPACSDNFFNHKTLASHFVFSLVFRTASHR
jgi:hypothetical protein